MVTIELQNGGHKAGYKVLTESWLEIRNSRRQSRYLGSPLGRVTCQEHKHFRSGTSYQEDSVLDNDYSAQSYSYLKECELPS
jgi:hypothetical protein